MKIAKRQAVIEKDERGELWAVCPYCRKKSVPLFPETRVYMFPGKCRNNKCPNPKKDFIINYNNNLCLI